MIHQSDYIYGLVPFLLAIGALLIVWIVYKLHFINIGYMRGRWRWGRLGPYPKYVNQPIPFFAIKDHIYSLPEHERQQRIVGCIYRWRFAVGPIEIRGVPYE